MKVFKEDLVVNIFKSIKVIFDIYCQSKNMTNFLNFQGELEPLSLIDLARYYKEPDLPRTLLSFLIKPDLHFLPPLDTLPNLINFWQISCLDQNNTMVAFGS